MWEQCARCTPFRAWWGQSLCTILTRIFNKGRATELAPTRPIACLRSPVTFVDEEDLLSSRARSPHLIALFLCGLRSVRVPQVCIFVLQNASSWQFSGAQELIRLM